MALLRDISAVTAKPIKPPAAKANFLSLCTLQWSLGVFVLILLVVLIVILQWLPSNLLWTSCPLWILLLPVCSPHPMRRNVTDLSYLQLSMPSTKPSSFWIKLGSKKSRSVQAEHRSNKIVAHLSIGERLLGVDLPAGRQVLLDSQHYYPCGFCDRQAMAGVYQSRNCVNDLSTNHAH